MGPILSTILLPLKESSIADFAWVWKFIGNPMFHLQPQVQKDQSPGVSVIISPSGFYSTHYWLSPVQGLPCHSGNIRTFPPVPVKCCDQIVEVRPVNASRDLRPPFPPDIEDRFVGCRGKLSRGTDCCPIGQEISNMPKRLLVSTPIFINH